MKLTSLTSTSVIWHLRYLFFTFHDGDEFIKLSCQLRVVFFNCIDFFGGSSFNMSLGMVPLHIIK